MAEKEAARIAATLRVRNTAVLLHNDRALRPIPWLGIERCRSYLLRLRAGQRQSLQRTDSSVHTIPEIDLATLKQINA